MNLPDLLSRWSLQPPQQLVAKASNHLPLWVSLVFVILIGYYLAKIAWLLYPPADEALWSPPPMPFATDNASGAPAGQNYQAIIDSHLFGTANVEPPPVIVEETDDAPDTRLNLKLRATVSADNQTIAHAIIADGSGKEKVYFVSDSIPGGAALHRVHPDRIILNRGGVLEALRLPKEFTGKSSSVSRRSTPTRAAKPATIQNLITANATTFTEIIRPQPFMPNGQLKGYRVFPGRNRQQFIALGLRPGDLVTAINGVALNNPAQGMEIFRSLSDSTQVTVTVERNGKSQDISLDIDKLNEIGKTAQ
ncbi:MAG: type II secretion system protein GspC [Gammaproteobacteria bacterium]|nr:type II secretion system protein GspC [Gammaproteobacteria bacterium]